eukprot:GHVU01086679.1.p1 GENE.GHVU01086679.1~~GHVU01086679.1.p1  ORF type:complete len:105 (+),score=7.87 GHVU01086679.1:94-408(+)
MHVPPAPEAAAAPPGAACDAVSVYVIQDVSLCLYLVSSLLLPYASCRYEEGVCVRACVCEFVSVGMRECVRACACVCMHVSMCMRAYVRVCERAWACRLQRRRE